MGAFSTPQSTAAPTAGKEIMMNTKGIPCLTPYLLPNPVLMKKKLAVYRECFFFLEQTLKHVWANLRKGDIVCECVRVNKTYMGEISPVCGFFFSFWSIVFYKKMLTGIKDKIKVKILC